MTADNAYFLAGLAAIATGLAFAWWPLALIVPGTIVCSLVVFAWVQRSREKVKTEEKS